MICANCKGRLYPGEGIKKEGQLFCTDGCMDQWIARKAYGLIKPEPKPKQPQSHTITLTYGQQDD